MTTPSVGAWLPLALAVLLWSVILGVLLPWAVGTEEAIERAETAAREAHVAAIGGK